MVHLLQRGGRSSIAGWGTAHFQLEGGRAVESMRFVPRKLNIVTYLEVFSVRVECKVPAGSADNLDFAAEVIFTSWKELVGSKQAYRGRGHRAGRETRWAPPSMAGGARNPTRRACKAPSEKFLHTYVD